MGHDHSWRCDWCSMYEEADQPRSETEPTLHEGCIGAREAQAERRRRYREVTLTLMAERPCALLASGECARVDSYGRNPDLAAAWHPQEGGRWLCDYHDKTENAERRAAEAEAQAAYDALPKELYCSTCETVVDPADVDDEPWYYCENCGDEFNRDATANDNHQCPSCNKFASRSDTDHCAHCQEELEVRVVEVAS